MALSNAGLDRLVCLVMDVEWPEGGGIYLPTALKVCIWKYGDIARAACLVRQYICKYGINHSFVVEAMWVTGLVGQDFMAQYESEIVDRTRDIVRDYLGLGRRAPQSTTDCGVFEFDDNGVREPSTEMLELKSFRDIELISVGQEIENLGLVIRDGRLSEDNGDLLGFDFGYSLMADQISVLQMSMQIRLVSSWMGNVWVIRYPISALLWSLTLRQCSRVAFAIILDDKTVLME